MKTNLCITWSVLSLGLLLSCAVDTYEPASTGRKKLFKLAAPKSKPNEVSTTDRDRKSSQRLPAWSQLGSQTPYPPPAHPAPPAAPAPPAPAALGSVRPGQPRPKTRPDFAHLPDVSVTCSTSDFVVRVKPAFYGLGADAEELKLGDTCRSTGVLSPSGDLLFTYPLTACGAVRQSPPGYLVYKFVLHYAPSPKRFPSRAHRLDVHIECRYQRNHHVYQLTVQPTWQTAVMRKRLKGHPDDFQMELMDDSWSKPTKSQVYQLGKPVHFQVSAPHLPTGGKLYINHCYAAPSSGSKSSLKYTIIDNFGCMLDSKRDPGASQFISRTDKTLRFSLKAFQFTSDPDTEINVHCKLFVTSEDPGPAHKSCTYRGNRWKALTGDDSICECCDSRCVTFKPRRAMMEGSASSGSLLVSDQPYTAEDGFLPISPSSVSMSKEDEATSHENLWGSADVVMYDYDDEEEGHTNEEEEEEEQLEEEEDSGGILRVMTETELEELGFRGRVLVEEKNESEVNDSKEFEENGSGFIVQEDFSESEEEEGFGISDVQQVNRSHQMEGEAMEKTFTSDVSLQRELQPLVSEGDNRKHTGEEGDRMMTSEVEWKKDEDLVDDRETTWYFTWRDMRLKKRRPK